MGRVLIEVSEREAQAVLEALQVWDLATSRRHGALSATGLLDLRHRVAQAVIAATEDAVLVPAELTATTDRVKRPVAA